MLAAKRNPWISLFDSDSEEMRHNQWVADKVARNLADTRASVPHDAAMARLDAILARAVAQNLA